VARRPEEGRKLTTSSIHGLRIRSEIPLPLPEFVRDDDEGAADVNVTLAEAATILGRACRNVPRDS
jgi:hypothetical protein